MFKEVPDYSGKKILFTAFSIVEGSEELAGYEFIKKYGATDISTLYWGNQDYADQIPDDIVKIKVDENNKFDPSVTANYDLIFRHQSTRPDLILGPTTTNTNEFFKYCRGPIIAITGTKGKGTTSTLISEIFDQAGMNNHLLGNIGNTAIQHIDEIQDSDVVIFEISSFQLWDLQYSPHIAVVLMMDIDHQDVHNSADEYIVAKANIVKYQTIDDLVIYHPTNEMSAKVMHFAKSTRKKFMTPEGAYIVEGQIIIDEVNIMPVADVGLIGPHNLENITAAITAAWEYTKNSKAIKVAVTDFMGLEHRLEFVADVDGVKYYDDSFSAATPATTAALNSFENPVIAIVGGYDKKVDLTKMAKSIISTGTKHVVLIGQTANNIKDILDANGYTNYTFDSNMKSMKSIVNKAASLAESGDVVVLSPGCASFDMFENYKQRGKLFKQAVADL